MGLPTLGHVKIDILSDSSLMFHCAPSTTGAQTVGGRLVKPKNFELTVLPIHKLVKTFVSTHCTVDIAAGGGATSSGLARLSDQLWERRPRANGRRDRSDSDLLGVLDVQRLRHLEPNEGWQVPRVSGH